MTRVVETDDAGDLVISPELLREMFGEVHPQARYVVEVQDDKIFITRESPAQETEQRAETAQLKPSDEQWEKQWRAAQEQVGKSWPAGVSATDVISEMRR